MRIADLDTNLVINSGINKPDLVWLDAAKEPFRLYGATGANPYVRMPLNVAETVSDGVFHLAQNTAGVRVRFRTDSPYIALHVTWDIQYHMAHMTDAGLSGFDLYTYDRDTKTQRFFAPFLPPEGSDKGYESVRDTTGVMTDYILNFPLYNPVSTVHIGVARGAQFELPATYDKALPVVFYGSSITQGGCATRPGNCYQNFLSRALNIDYVNLGFSGNGKAEDTMVQYLAQLPMAVFVSDYDHNAPTAAYLNDTHYKMYETIRRAQPTLPYVMVSKPDFKAHTEDPQRREIIQESYRRAVESGDKNVYFIDGLTLFGEDERDACTVDGCHPNDLGFYRMAQGIYPILNDLLK